MKGALQCWRNSTLSGRGKYDLLITGCGYSATSFFSNAFTEAGYPLGHEVMESHGTSDWTGASRHGMRIHPFQFNHIMLLVRHPLKVLNSWYGTQWNFQQWDEEIPLALHEDLILQDRVAFEQLKGEFKALEWWVSFTLLGENMAECFVRNEDISAEMLLQLCHRADLPDCDSKDWNSIVSKNAGSNAHNKHHDDRATWAHLEEIALTPLDLDILLHVKKECLRFGYTDCGMDFKSPKSTN
eukprot:CAMPEP_0183734050 /NCGR_PEP_ID=MMETSP0737-20130205/42762_1 /TAXON_ID=385413 /ORGANISM="Thalassiosira miniscula, Strain CCMP1093" /LENGTH=240 /DNA_ID=CAMNT_0025967443 /DNA_START=254 /DNA_END=976 /DNA_ORIENTATION=-